MSGSSTVEPISALVGELFSAENPDVAVRVDGPGTSDGFELFCEGQTDISDASRAIDEEEVAACEAAGIEYVELKIGIDGLTVITNPANDAVECLSFEQLYGLVGPESEGFDNWSDANTLVTEIGGEGDLPDAQLDITAPGEESGTYDSFIEIALGDIAEARVAAGAITEDQAETTRKDYSSQANDNAIIEGIGGSDTSLGWVGFAFADQNQDAVRSLEVDGGDGCVAPTAETIADGTLPGRTAAVHLREHGQGRRESRPERVRRLLSLRRRLRSRRRSRLRATARGPVVGDRFHLGRPGQWRWEHRDHGRLTDGRRNPHEHPEAAALASGCIGAQRGGAPCDDERTLTAER